MAPTHSLLAHPHQRARPGVVEAAEKVQQRVAPFGENQGHGRAEDEDEDDERQKVAVRSGRYGIGRDHIQ